MPITLDNPKTSKTKCKKNAFVDFENGVIVKIYKSINIKNVKISKYENIKDFKNFKKCQEIYKKFKKCQLL